MKYALKELWGPLHPLGFERGTYMVLWGYIDDSGDGKKILTLSCLIGDSPAWYYLGLEWEAFIAQKNAELVAQGCTPITRFHASDCSCRLEEFEGWSTQDDQIPFMQGLLSLMEKYRFDVIAYTIDLEELAKHIPISKPNPRSFAHVMLLHYIMLGIAEGSLKNNRDAVIGIIHDRSDYDSVLLDAFNLLINDETFTARGRFASITPMGWEHCVPLQQADLMAYENYKESRREFSRRDRRKSLEWILERGQLGGFLRGFNADTLDAFKKHLDGLHPQAREAFLRAARIPVAKQSANVKINREYDAFNSAMKTILRADPKAVKEAMEKESQAQAAERKARGERKRGRKKATKK